MGGWVGGWVGGLNELIGGWVGGWMGDLPVCFLGLDIHPRQDSIGRTTRERPSHPCCDSTDKGDEEGELGCFLGGGEEGEEEAPGGVEDEEFGHDEGDLAVGWVGGWVGGWVV